MENIIKDKCDICGFTPRQPVHCFNQSCSYNNFDSCYMTKEAWKFVESCYYTLNRIREHKVMKHGDAK